MKSGSEFESSEPLFVGILEMETAFQTHARVCLRVRLLQRTDGTRCATRWDSIPVGLPGVPLRWQAGMDTWS